MKLITAIIQDKDARELENLLTKNQIATTKLASKGGFLKAQNVTFMMAVADEQVDYVLGLIKSTAKRRKQMTTPSFSLEVMGEESMMQPIEIEVGGATVMVTPIEQFHQY
ncbi:cyclic-di-AMP receptor [Holzapfeliella sp. He02]|uniref:Cyclic-di-AMP receptor n=1 Tax=Holzapfeliella saturejae TaxID=3082953 RepID=A0ABU8SGV0_9LACO